MYPKKIYYPHKIIYLLFFLFRNPNILLLTLLFVYTLPCFHLLALERNKGIFDHVFKSLANDRLDIVGGYDVDDQMFEDDEKVGLIIKHGHHDLFLK